MRCQPGGVLSSSVTDDDWRERLVAVIAGEVRRYRDMRGMSAQQLADRCTELGMPLKRSVLANFESGRRPTVSVPELVILAKALEVPPVRLIFPLGYQEEAELLPGRSLDTWDALKWFSEEPTQMETPPEIPQAVRMFRRHDELVGQSQRIAREYMDALAAVVHEADDAQREIKDQLAEMQQRRLNDTRKTLRDLRAGMRRRGLIPPRLPEGFTDIDAEETP